MAKNRKYKNVYQITFEGTTSNGFTPTVQDKMIRAIVVGMGNNQSGKVTLEVVETKGDFNAKTGEIEDDTTRR